MAWVRGPWWDGFWLLSGLPIGVVLMLYVLIAAPAWSVDSQPMLWTGLPLIAVAIMILETGHVVSPMLLAWSKPGLRAIVFREWGTYLMLPVVLVAACLLLPWSVVFGIYFAWNIWHFGMQIFGVSCLYHSPQSADGRFWRAFGCVAMTAFSIGVLPMLGEGPRAHMISLGIFSFNHWLVDIGLSSQVSGWRWGFISLVLSIGVAWLVLRNGPLSVQVVPQILAIRAGIGMIHFVYSARVWRLSDPQVRTAIGKELFA